MRFKDIIESYSEIPFSRHFILELLKDYNRPNDKISELLKSGELISLKKGLYMAGKKLNLKLPEPFLIANNLWGPSYVSLDTALSFWGIIPEKVYEVSSVTINSSKKYTNQVGRFTYMHQSPAFYSVGYKSEIISPNQTVLIAQPEKALIDKIVHTSGINLRSKLQVESFLFEDLRIDEELIKKFNLSLIEEWLTIVPKRSSIEQLIKYLNK